jgi:hypothetical protein
MTDEILSKEPTWFIDEGIPGIGDRPSWLHDKFKTAADLAKSYSELEKKVGQVPEDYNMQSKYLDPDYGPFQDMLSLAREKRVPKEVIDKLSESVDKYFDEFSIDYEAESKKLGDNVKERLQTLDNWAKANMSKESYEALLPNLKTADSIKALEELRSKMMSNTTMIPGGNDKAASNIESLEDVRAELTNNLVKYKSDPHYRKDLQSRLALASKSSNMVDKIGY